MFAGRDLVVRLLAVDLLDDAIEKLRQLDEPAVALDEPLLIHEARVRQLADELHTWCENRSLRDLDRARRDRGLSFGGCGHEGGW
jgi:hypothetical protein